MCTPVSRVTVSFNYFGKIVLKIRDEESKKTLLPAPKKVLAVPKTFVDPAKAYVVIGIELNIEFFLNFFYNFFLFCVFNFKVV